MKTSIKLRKWSGIDDTVHVATSYRIATDETMLNIIDEVIESSDKLNLYNSDITIPLNTTYYVSVKRKILSTSGVVLGTEWSTPTPIRNYESPTGILVEDDIYVEMPYIFVDKADILDESTDTFFFRTSEFRSNSEGHRATHFFIFDSLGKLVFKRMNEIIGKLGVNVGKLNINLGSTSELIFKVIHVTPSGVESPVSKLYVNLTKSNVAITSRLKNIVPFTDYTLRITKINNSDTLRVSNIVITNIDETEDMWSADIIPDKLEYVIPYRLLTPDSKYVLKVTTIDIDGVNTIKKIMNTIEAFGNQRKQPEYVYKNNVKHITNSFGPLLSTNATYTLLNNGMVITKDNTGKNFKIWNVDIVNYKLTNPVTVNGLATLIDNDDNVYIDIREDGTILIDCLNEFGYPTFLLYKYDSFRNSAVLLDTIVRSSETKSMGFNNGIIRDEANIYYYIPVGKNYINKLDLTTSEVTKLYNIDNASNYNVLARLESGKLGIFTGSETILSYDIQTNEVYQVLTLPNMFRDRDLRFVNLINNDLLIFLKEVTDSDNGFMLSFDASSGMLRKVTKEYVGPEVNYESSILLSSGELLLLHNTLDTDQYYLYY